MINLLKEAGYTGLIVQITGEPGKGKTKMALSTGASFGATALINADTKRALVSQLFAAGAEFGYYRDAIADTRGMKEIDTHMAYLKWFDEIEKLPPNQRRVIIIDAWEKFEITLKPMVERKPKEFADYWSTMGTFKGAQQWQQSHSYSSHILSRLSGLCEILIITSHLRNAYKGSVKIPGKFKPDNKVPVVQKCDMRIWLRENSKSPIPIALMMKRGLMKVDMAGGKPKLVNVLPKRLEARGDEQDIWDVVERYWNNPMGTRSPRPEETPNEFEISILEGTLTEDQQEAWKREVESQKEMERMEEELTNQSVLDAWKDVGEEMGRIMEVVESTGLSVGEIMGIVG